MSCVRDSQLDRAVGLVLGCAIGDAVGAPMDFREPNPADQSTWVTEMVSGGALDHRIGATTSATALMLSTLESYLESQGKLSKERMIAKLSTINPLDDWTSGAVKLWQRSLLSHRCVQQKSDYRVGSRTLNPVKQALADITPGLNAPLLRILPVALVRFKSTTALLSEAASVCELTHPNPTCIYCCQVIARVASRLICDTKDDKGNMAGNKVGKYSIHELWVDLMRAALSDKQTEVYTALRESAAIPWARWLNSPTSVGSLGIAFTTLLQSPNFEAGLIALVNRGGNASTCGAIAGALLGARYGYSAIPKQWLRILSKHEELRQLAIKLWLLKRPR